MIAAIMQPYFFPYIGYFQLMNAVDLFIVYDDAQFMKGGWVNRNRILVTGKAHWWTYALRHDDHTLPINRRHYHDAEHSVNRLHAQLANAYRHAPHYREVHAWLRSIWPDDVNVASFNEITLTYVARKLGLRCEIQRASSIPIDDARGEERVIRLCKATGVDTYLNAIGGVALYDKERFRAHGLELRFLTQTVHAYPQFTHAPVVGLSIVDVLMFRGFEGTAETVHQKCSHLTEPRQ